MDSLLNCVQLVFILQSNTSAMCCPALQFMVKGSEVGSRGCSGSQGGREGLVELSGVKLGQVSS
jgi:hypothetical protein